MAFKNKLFIFFLIVLLLWLSLPLAWGFIRTKYIYPMVKSWFTGYVKEKWAGDLHVASITGNAVTRLYLKGIYVDNIKGYPKDLALKADSVKIWFTPFSLLAKHYDLEFRKGSLVYKDAVIPLDIQRYANTTITSLDFKGLDLASVKDILPHEISLYGLINIKGKVISRFKKPARLNIKIESLNCGLIFDKILNAQAKISFSISGLRHKPLIAGQVNITDLDIKGGPQALNLAKLKGVTSQQSAWLDSLLDINIYGNDLFFVGQNLSGVISADLKLKKETKELPYLLGSINVKRGSYYAFDNLFEINQGEIIFAQKNASPSMDIRAKTKIRRYKIIAQVKGTILKPQLVLESKPQLSSIEIVSLIAFGKKINDLNILEKDRLRTEDLNNLVLNNIFLGKAETKLAATVGLDEIEVTFDASKALGSPSFKLGKYIVDDTFYGTYSLKPSGVYHFPEQNIGGELELTDYLILKGERSWRDSFSQPQEKKVTLEFNWKF